MSLDTAKSVILLPPLSFLKNAPFVTMFSGTVENNVLVTYPVSLFDRDTFGKIEWLGFLYIFLYTGKDGRKVGHITYPLCFDASHRREIFERLLSEVEELATAFGASRMEYEGYQHVTGEMFQPVSAIKFGNTPDADFLEFVKDKGFTQKGVSPCYEVESPEIKEEPISVYTIADDHERRRAYLEVCRLSDSFPQLFDVDQILASPPGIAEQSFFHKEWVVFTESGEEKGVLRWFPQSLFGGEGAKIARMLFFEATPEFVCSSVTETLKWINNSGISRIQVADIPEGSPTEDVLKELGGTRVYETVHMVKEY